MEITDGVHCLLIMFCVQVRMMIYYICRGVSQLIRVRKLRWNASGVLKAFWCQDSCAVLIAALRVALFFKLFEYCKRLVFNAACRAIAINIIFLDYSVIILILTDLTTIRPRLRRQHYRPRILSFSWNLVLPTIRTLTGMINPGYLIQTWISITILMIIIALFIYHNLLVLQKSIYLIFIVISAQQCFLYAFIYQLQYFSFLCTL